ncbi:MAG: 7-cyano-7-deazaguanine synthase [marine bacterium B5-7]|nr:MAG: 7-cyano-7-deazaguanine synthase [marine bacterium B5-7]
MKKAVVLVSGGLDSATVLALAKEEGYTTYALSFDYGQRHRAELQAAKMIAKAFNAAEHHVVQFSLQHFQGCALTDENTDVPDYQGDGDIPVTYVPARNTIFLSFAMGWAEVLGAQTIMIGASSVDYSGYPDCRPEYFDAFQQMANLATKAGVEGDPLKIVAPLMHLSKAETIQAGIAAGVDYTLTVSCYQADEQGRACGRCDSCVLRKKGFEEAGVVDPTRYVKC